MESDAPSTGIDARHRTDRGVRLARGRVAIAAAALCAYLGWPDPGGHLGNVAPSSVLFERDAAKRVVFLSLFHRVRRSLRDRNSTV